MSKFSNFVKKLLLKLKEEIVMEQPEVEPRNFPKVTERQNTKYSQVRKHLIEKGSIDSWTAINLYGATRLSAIIFKLRSKGYQIDSISRTAYDRNQELCNFTTYKYNNNNGVN
jgi:hypothetical protein